MTAVAAKFYRSQSDTGRPQRPSLTGKAKPASLGMVEYPFDGIKSLTFNIKEIDFKWNLLILLVLILAIKGRLLDRRFKHKGWAISWFLFKTINKITFNIFQRLLL